MEAYATPLFSAKQMHQIRQGLEQGIDVSVFANPEIPADQMRAIRHVLFNKKIDY